MGKRNWREMLGCAAAAFAVLAAVVGLVVAWLSMPTVVVTRAPDGEISADEPKRPVVEAWSVLQFDNESSTVCTAVIRDEANGAELMRWVVGAHQTAKMRLAIVGAVQVECAESPEQRVTVVIPRKPLVSIGRGVATGQPGSPNDPITQVSVEPTAHPPATVIVIGATDEHPDTDDDNTPEPRVDPATQITFTTDRLAVRPGECAVLTWSTASGSRVFLDGEGEPRTGRERVCPAHESTYELRVVLQSGATVRRSVVVRVLREEPLMVFRAEPEEVVAGDCAELWWETEHIDRVYLDGQGVAGDGSRLVCPNVTEEHALEVHLRDGTVRRLTAHIRVVPAVYFIWFDADQTSVDAGRCTTLRWSVEGIDSVYLDGGGVTGSGSRQVCPTRTTSYTLRVRLLDGKDELRTVTVVVAPTTTPWPTSTRQPTATPTLWIWRPTLEPTPTATPCRSEPYPGYPPPGYPPPCP